MIRQDFEKSIPQEILRGWIKNETPISICGFNPLIVAKDGPTNKTMVNGLVHLDETYMLTLLTDQSTKMVTEIILQGDFMVVKGVFTKEIFESPNGEKYRPIFGRIEAA